MFRCVQLFKMSTLRMAMSNVGNVTNRRDKSVLKINHWAIGRASRMMQSSLQGGGPSSLTPAHSIEKTMAKLVLRHGTINSFHELQHLSKTSVKWLHVLSRHLNRSIEQKYTTWWWALAIADINDLIVDLVLLANVGCIYMLSSECKWKTYS